jgi:hypothetical protein
MSKFGTYCQLWGAGAGCAASARRASANAKSAPSIPAIAVAGVPMSETANTAFNHRLIFVSRAFIAHIREPW